MSKTLGETLASLRKQSGLTQDAVAEYIGVSPQAVSKWETDASCPDIMLLPKIAELYGVSIDDLFSDDAPHAQPTAEEKFRKTEFHVTNSVNTDELYLYVYVNSRTGDEVKVRVPFPLVRQLLNTGKNVSGLFGTDLSGIDLESIFTCVQSGQIGEIATVTTSNGDLVRIVVEK